MSVNLQKRHFSAADYHLMVQANIIAEDERVELLNGEVIEMSPVGDRHIGTVNWLSNYLGKNLEAGRIVSVQNPIHLGDYSEPEPDIAICREVSHFYREKKAGPEDIFLVIEVADTSLEKDRQIKCPLYAAAGIPVCWIVNLVDDQVEVYEKPEQGRYTSRAILSRNDTLMVPESGVEVQVQALLG